MSFLPLSSLLGLCRGCREEFKSLLFLLPTRQHNGSTHPTIIAFIITESNYSTQIFYLTTNCTRHQFSNPFTFCLFSKAGGPKASVSATLFMEVSYTFHSHLIGKAGKNINSLMDETGTRIHFPDGNRMAGHSKSNSVIIRGEIDKLENVRQRIRVSHIVLFFALFHNSK